MARENDTQLMRDFIMAVVNSEMDTLPGFIANPEINVNDFYFGKTALHYAVDYVIGGAEVAEEVILALLAAGARADIESTHQYEHIDQNDNVSRKGKTVWEIIADNDQHRLFYILMENNVPGFATAAILEYLVDRFENTQDEAGKNKLEDVIKKVVIAGAPTGIFLEEGEKPVIAEMINKALQEKQARSGEEEKEQVQLLSPSSPGPGKIPFPTASELGEILRGKTRRVKINARTVMPEQHRLLNPLGSFDGAGTVEEQQPQQTFIPVQREGSFLGQVIDSDLKRKAEIELEQSGLDPTDNSKKRYAPSSGRR